MKTLKKKGDIEISKLIGLIIGVIALILIITFIYLNWKPLKESLGKIGENVLGQTKDLLEVDKKQFYDQTLTTQDQQLDEMIGDISKKFDCTIQPGSAIDRWKKAIEIISGSKYKGKWKGREPELQYKVVECYTKVDNLDCDKISKEFKILRDEIQPKGAVDFTSPACSNSEILRCLNEEDKSKCEKRIETAKPTTREEFKEAITKLKLDGLIGFNKKYKEAIDFYNNKKYARSEDIARDLADSLYAVFPKFGESKELCEEIGKRDGIDKELCLQSDKFYLSSRYIEISSKLLGGKSCEEIEGSYKNDFAIDITSLSSSNLQLKYISFIQGTKLGSSDLSGKPIGSQIFYDLGKCFEEKNNLPYMSRYYNYLLISYPGEDTSKTLIREKEPKLTQAGERCKDFDKVIGYSAEACNKFNSWLDVKLKEVDPRIKRRLKCWSGAKAALPYTGTELYSICKPCTLIKSCSDYGEGKTTCEADPCGFGCKFEGALSGNKCVIL